MAKKKASNSNLLVLAAAGVAIIAIILAMFLPGAIHKTDYGTSTVTLIGFMFGSLNFKNVTTVGDVSKTTQGTYSGGLSTFGLIALILLVIGIVAIVASKFVSGKKLDLIGSVAILLAGIFLLLLLSGGSNVAVTENVSITFEEAFEQYKLGAGAIICAIICILGGLCGAYGAVKGK